MRVGRAKRMGREQAKCVHSACQEGINWVQRTIVALS
jgi:hypothetical protein